MLTTMFNQKHLNMKSATDVINKLLKTYFAIPVWSSLWSWSSTVRITIQPICVDGCKKLVRLLSRSLDPHHTQHLDNGHHHHHTFNTLGIVLSRRRNASAVETFKTNITNVTLYNISSTENLSGPFAEHWTFSLNTAFQTKTQGAKKQNNYNLSFLPPSTPLARATRWNLRQTVWTSPDSGFLDSLVSGLGKEVQGGDNVT